MGPLNMSRLDLLAQLSIGTLGYIDDIGLTGNEALEERLGGQVGIVGLKVLLGWGHKLDGSELVSADVSATLFSTRQ